MGASSDFNRILAKIWNREQIPIQILCNHSTLAIADERLIVVPKHPAIALAWCFKAEQAQLRQHAANLYLKAEIRWEKHRVL